jgi:tRNA nucleotidyltransferase (CCA-adding enzyme)
MEVYLVGGAVRDRLLSLPIHERDWVVVGATPEDLLAEGYRQVGKDFPVFIHPKTGEEYALARTERKAGKGHQAFTVNSTPSITLEDDLARRDLTINAIAEDSDGKLIDYHHGLKDLEDKVLRHISPAFSEDPLRVLRVARFAARYWKLGFTIAPETLQLMSSISNSDELSYLSKERVWNETRLALQTDNPEIYFLVTWQVGALQKLARPLADALRLNDNLLRLADIRKLDGLEARYIGLCMVAGLRGDVIDSAIVRQLNDSFNPKGSLQDFALLTARYLFQCMRALSLNEREIYDVFCGLDAFRRTDRCIEILQYFRQIQTVFGLGKTDAIEFLIDCIPVLNTISADEQIKSLSGEKIGEAIAQRRISKIKELKAR